MRRRTDSPLVRLTGLGVAARSTAAVRGSPVADDQDKERAERAPREADSADAVDSKEQSDAQWSAWGNLWQIPVLFISTTLIVAGIFYASTKDRENDFRGALDQVENFIESGRLDLAASQLNDVIKPSLLLATSMEQARYYVLVGDWVAAKLIDEGVNTRENHTKIVEQYSSATELGAILSAPRIERWAISLLEIGDRDGALKRLAEIEGLLAAVDAEPETRRIRNRILRRLVEQSLKQEDLSYKLLMALLDDYRADQMLTIPDSSWAIARQAELRLEAGYVQQAIDRLLLDMRRFELDSSKEDIVNYGELYTLLGRGYYDLGEYPDAEFNLQKALKQFVGPEPVRGNTLVLLGQVDIANGEWLDAFGRFDEVARDYQATKSYLPGILGRAEVHSILGDHEKGLEDYSLVLDLLARSGPRRDVNAPRVSRSLTDRHETSLTAGKLDIALEYVLLAEKLFDPGLVSTGTLLRIAYTSRQLADDLLRAATGEDNVQVAALEKVDPAIRHKAMEHYRNAADYYVRRARSLASAIGQDDSWADSLWIAADSYDLAGFSNQAALHFEEYIAGRSEADPRRPEAFFRLGKCAQADGDYEIATLQYETVIAKHPRSQFAAASHVPLARCYLARDRKREAQQQLEMVLQGNALLNPNAPEYRDALFELGELFYDAQEYLPAIERLDKARQRYADDPRANEILFHLADSYRLHAEQINEKLKDPVLSPIERGDFVIMRRRQLEKALGFYSQMTQRDDSTGPLPADRLQQQVLRSAYLYQGHCAFDLENYEEAVGMYNAAAARFPEHHSSITALIQIVNCYYKLGDDKRMINAHNRAIVKLSQLPDSAFEEDDNLIDRGTWELWLRNIPLGNG